MIPKLPPISVIEFGIRSKQSCGSTRVDYVMKSQKALLALLILSKDSELQES